MMKSAGVGVVCAVGLALLAFVVGSKTVLVTTYLVPGTAIAGVLSGFVPSAFVYWVDPDGGPSAFLLEALVGSVLSWSVLFGVIHYHRHRFKRQSR